MNAYSPSNPYEVIIETTNAQHIIRVANFHAARELSHEIVAEWMAQQHVPGKNPQYFVIEPCRFDFKWDTTIAVYMTETCGSMPVRFLQLANETLGSLSVRAVL